MLNIQIFHQTKAESYTHNYFLCSTFPAVKKKKVERKHQSHMASLWLAIQKEVISKPKQPSCKKECGPQKGQDEKDVKSKVAAKKWL